LISLFLLGLPGETRGSVVRTLEFILDLGLAPAEFDIGIITPYPGTELHTIAASKGWISGEQADFTSYTPVMRTDELDVAELAAAQDFADRLAGAAADPAGQDAYRGEIRAWAGPAGTAR
jgi:radical SAM superfamily enzyme YgiQ (UPF0313 family)